MIRMIDNERGAVLVTVLMVLLILTLIGFAAMESSDMEGRMTTNLYSHNLALQSAEMALRDAESYLKQEALPAFSGSNAVPSSDGLYQPTVDVSSLDWNDTDSVAFSGDLPMDAAAKPRYIIEDLGTVASSSAAASIVAGTEVQERNTYRITAYGVGLRTTSVVILQSTYTP